MSPSIERFNCLLDAVATGDSNVMLQFRPAVLPYLRVIARRAMRSKQELPAWDKTAPGEGSGSLSSRAGGSSQGGGSGVGRLARQIYGVLVETVQSKRPSASRQRTRLFGRPPTIRLHASPAQRAD